MVLRATFPSLALLILAGCSHGTKTETTNLVVFGAASLKEVFTQESHAFEAQNPNVKVTLSFAGSQQLALQIGQGAPCDVFASADQKQMDVAQQSGRIPEGHVLKFAENRLVIVTPDKSKIHSVEDLAKKGLKVVLAGDTVPAGAYAVKMLAKGGSVFQKQVLKNVVSYEQDVRAVLTKVALGEADAGVVYGTDIKAATGVRMIELSRKFEITSAYYIAVLNGPNQAIGSKFMAFVMSPKGQKLFKDDGFITPTK